MERDKIGRTEKEEEEEKKKYSKSRCLDVTVTNWIAASLSHRGYDSDILASPIYYGVGFANEPKHFPGPC